MINALTKASDARNRAMRHVSLAEALKNGGPLVWESCLMMGLGNIASGQIIKGLVFFAIEAASIAFVLMPNGGAYWISMLSSLGWREQEKVWNEEKFIYEYVAGDQSQLILLYGIASLCVIAVAVIFWQVSVRSGYKASVLKKNGCRVPTFKDDVASLFDENIHMFLMTPPTVCLLIFTILPLLYILRGKND